MTTYVNASSTDSEVRDEYDNCAAYKEENSLSKAKRFVVACRILIRRTPSLSSQAGRQMAFSLPLLREELSRALNFVDTHPDTTNDSSNPAANQAKYFSFENMPRH